MKKNYLALMVMALALATSIGGLLLKGHVPKALAVSMFLIGALTATFAFVAFIIYQTKQVAIDTQRIISDKALMEVFENQPGGLLSVHMLAEKTGLKTGQARSRANALVHAGILSRGVNKSAARYFFELTSPLDRVSGLDLSPEPYLTVEDLQKIFIAYDHKVSPQDLVMATELPWNVLAREMEHFRKKGVVEGVRIKRPGDSPVQYILLEPYLSAPIDASAAQALNLELREILLDEELLV